MRYLADTHIVIWALNWPEKISPAVKACLASRRHPCFYSSLSLWEIAIKYGIGKLDLRGHTPEEFLAEVDASFFDCLPLDNQVITTSYQLPRLHSDPFDRLLVWQAMATGCTLLSADPATDQYVPHGLRVVH